MTDLPFLLQVARPRATSGGESAIDRPTSDDPLPAALDVDGSGLLKARETKITCVQQETTDDQ
jgi:hypothetical protein